MNPITIAIAIIGIVSLIILFITDQDDVDRPGLAFMFSSFFGTLFAFTCLLFLNKMYGIKVSLHDPRLIYSIIGYFAIGFIYSPIRWINRCKKILEDSKEFLTRYNLNSIENIFDTYADIHNKVESGNDSFKLHYLIENLNPINNKMLCCNWVLFWPLCFINNFIPDVVTIINRNLASLYKKILNRYMKKILVN